MKTLLTIILTTLICTGVINASPLQNIWNKRIDLQTTFPNGYQGNGWILEDWAREYGYKEEPHLKQFNEEYEKEYIYQKYLPLERALGEIASRQYTDEYHCKHFTSDLQSELNEVGIETLKVNGDVNGQGHWWIAIQIEPLTGEFVSSDYEVRRVDATKKFIKLIR